jgi:acylglycerol lipase
MRLDQRMISTFDGERLFVSFSELGHKYWIIMTHGVGEHSGRHHHVAAFFSQFANVCLYDLRGHGKSSGERAFVNDFFSFSRDLMEVVSFLKEEFKMSNFILYAHSMGALVTCDFMQNHKLIKSDVLNKEAGFYPAMVFLSAPPVQPAGWVGGVVKRIPQYWLNVLASFNKSAKIAGILDIFYLSHDVRVFEDYLKDPLNSTKLHTKLLLQIVKRARIVFSRALAMECPVHVVVGTKDRLVGHKDVIDYFHRLEPSAHMHVVDEGYHELHNEVERIRVKFMNILQDSIIKFIKSN